jgi:Helix-turn-helix domain
MSIKLMSRVWELELDDSFKLTLLALADAANDEGFCWPGVASLCKKTSRSERTIQGAIQGLVDMGHITRKEVPGKGCTYTVHPRNNCAPAETAPPQGTTGTPAKSAGKPLSNRNRTSGAKAPSVPREKRVDTALPDDFEVPEEWLQWAMTKKGWTRRDAEYEAERFVNHAIQNDRKCKAWERAWRNWCLSDLCKTKSAGEARQEYLNGPVYV